MTFLLRNPDKVREMVKQGLKLLVKYEDQIVMEITIPTFNNLKNTTKLPPVLKMGKTKSSFNRTQIYDAKY